MQEQSDNLFFLRIHGIRIEDYVDSLSVDLRDQVLQQQGLNESSFDNFDEEKRSKCESGNFSENDLSYFAGAQTSPPRAENEMSGYLRASAAYCSKGVSFGLKICVNRQFPSHLDIHWAATNHSVKSLFSFVVLVKSATIGSKS